MAAYERVQVTPELLQAAWAQPRAQHWPATFEATQADPFYSRLLRGRAIALALANRRQQQAPFDARRAAANDLE